MQPPRGLRLAPAWPALVDVTVVNPGGERRTRQTILLHGDRLETIRDAGPTDPKDLRARAFVDRFVLPGLIDLDVRQPPSFLRLQALTGLMYLAAGVTTVRDVGNFDGDLLATQAVIDNGTLAFPRLVACQREVEGQPPRCPSSLTVNDAHTADAAVAALAAAGAQCVHVRDSLPEDTRAAIAAAARSRHLPLIADPPASGQPYAPVLAPWYLSHLASAASDGPPEPFQTYLPEAVRTIIWPAQVERVAAAGLTMHQTLIRTMSAAVALRDTSLLLGSGAPALYAAPGGSARVAMETLVAIGASREDVWAGATRRAGEILGIPQLGRIEPGAPADLLIFREDPTQRPQAMITLEAVISRGRLYPSATLIGQILEHVRYQDRWLVKALRALQTRWLLWRKPATLLECQLP